MIAHPDSETDTRLIANAVRELVRRTHFPVAFGGLERDGAVYVSSVMGARTRSIDGLIVHAARGLGGRALVEKRPRLALDYKSSRTITHDYDRVILGEGIATLLAVPVVVSGRTRGVLYCGSWAQSAAGDLATRSAFGIADELATELRVREEVSRRLSLVPPSTESSALPAAAREELRESYAELRSITATVGDTAVRIRLAKLEQRLAALTHDDADARKAPGIHLSPRETDVLACAALGSTNAEIATSLMLKEGTVKSYLQSAMAKLDASTRHAAVTRARREGLLP